MITNPWAMGQAEFKRLRRGYRLLGDWSVRRHAKAISSRAHLAHLIHTDRQSYFRYGQRT
jgi:hypothetical protein